VGSREGLASQIVAGAVEPEDPGGRFESYLYQESSAARVEYGTVSSIVLLGLDYREREFLVPSGGVGGVNLLTPPSAPATFRANVGYKVLGSTVDLGGSKFKLYLAYRG